MSLTDSEIGRQLECVSQSMLEDPSDWLDRMGPRDIKKLAEWLKQASVLLQEVKA